MYAVLMKGKAYKFQASKYIGIDKCSCSNKVKDVGVYLILNYIAARKYFMALWLLHCSTVNCVEVRNYIFNNNIKV